MADADRAAKWRIPVAIKAYLGVARIPLPTAEVDALAQAEAEKKLGLQTSLVKFGSLAFNDYIEVLLRHERAPKLSQARDVTELRGLLQRVRDARNKLAHFRGELTSEERRTIRLAADWLEQNLPTPIVAAIPQRTIVLTSETVLPGTPEFEAAAEEPDEPLGTYAPLARHLRSAPSNATTLGLSFEQIERILQIGLPRSAYQYRGWWSNDPTKPQSASWLEEGWRTNAVNMTERRLNFVRTDDRERAYITFFAHLKESLSREQEFSLRDGSPQGLSWHTLASLDRSDSAALIASFSRRKRLRVEIYLDYGEKEKTKARFDEQNMVSVVGSYKTRSTMHKSGRQISSLS